MSSPSLRPLIDTCQKCSTSPANNEPRSPANGGFQNPGICPQAVPSFPSPTPTVLFLALAPFSAQAKYRKPRSSVFLCSQTLRKRLLRRLIIPELFVLVLTKRHVGSGKEIGPQTAVALGRTWFNVWPHLYRGILVYNICLISISNNCLLLI